MTAFLPSTHVPWDHQRLSCPPSLTIEMSPSRRPRTITPSPRKTASTTTRNNSNPSTALFPSNVLFRHGFQPVLTSATTAQISTIIRPSTNIISQLVTPRTSTRSHPTITTTTITTITTITIIKTGTTTSTTGTTTPPNATTTKTDCLSRRNRRNHPYFRNNIISFPSGQMISDINFITTTTLTTTITMVAGDEPPETGTDTSPEYEPSDEDRADTTSDTPLELSLAQQLLMKQYESQIDQMSIEECRKLAMEVARQMMIKDNILKGMLKDEKALEFIRSLQPPDPYSPEFNDDDDDDEDKKQAA